MEKKMKKFYELRNLDISFETTAGVVNAVRGVNLTVKPGRDGCNRWGIRFR